MLGRSTVTGRSRQTPFEWLGRFVVRRPLIVIGLWLAAAAVLFLMFPPLLKIAGQQPPEFLPADAPVLVASEQMREAFQEPDAGNLLLVVLTNEDGLGPDDEAVYRRLVDNLTAAHDDIVTVQDFISTPAIREVMTSKDNKGWYLPISLAGTIGTPEANQSYQRAVEIVKETATDTTLTASLTGPAATLGDLTVIGAHDQHVIEIATGLMVLTILLLVYRNPITMVLPLATIALSLVIAQQVIAGFVQVGLNINPQALVLVSAMMLGAGTDYAVFLISRYHECVRHGSDSDTALVLALASIGKVITASAGTVAITFLAMSFAQLSVFAAIGPALAITISVGCLASITLLPAMITLAGRRGWVKPRRDLTGRFWRRSGVHIIRRPVTHLVVSMAVLTILASSVVVMKFNWDDRQNLPTSADSNIGYETMARHFPVNETIQQFLFIQSPNDLRTPKALADLEQMVQRVSQLPGIAAVRGITRPTGETLEQAKTTYQAGQVGDKLHEGADQIISRDKELSMLTDGAHKLADVLGEARGGVVDAIASVRGLTDALLAMQGQVGGATTMAEIDKTSQLVTSMHDLGDAIGLNLTQVDDVYRWAAPVLTALNAGPACDLDPSCRESRVTLQRLVTAHDDGSLKTMADLGRELQNTHGSQSLSATVDGLQLKLDQVMSAARQLGIDSPQGVDTRLAELQQGVDALADGSEALAQGVQLLVDQVRKVTPGLTEASSFLMAMRDDARSPSMSGFYIPPAILTQKEFREAAAMFVSPDGHAVRYMIQTDVNPFGTEAMDQVAEILETARAARPNTSLEGASIALAGIPAANDDIRNYFNHDLVFIFVATIVVVLAILMLLLRAVVAPLYLIGSVIVSYLSAVGIGVVFFQLILDKPLAWNVPGMAFIVLVAVGADYNLLLISRIRDEASHGIRSAVIRTVGSTGGVITSAGVIFAASMLGLTFSSILNVVQIGFVIGCGLLLDTFVVRTLTVPAIATLVGRANWWPSRWEPVANGPQGQRASVPGAVTSIPPTTGLPEPVRTRRRRDVAALAAVVGGVVLAAGSAYGRRSGRKAKSIRTEVRNR